MIKAIIFDGDGVILDTHAIYCKSDGEFFGSLGVNLDPNDYSHHLTGRTLKNGVLTMKNLFGISGNVDELLAKRIEVVKKNYFDINLIPGFLDFFNLIKNSYKTAIATSSETELFQIADSKLNLKSLFNRHIYFPKDVAHVSKPAPDIYLHAASQLGVSPIECLVIEDAPNGIKSAKAAGMKCVGILTTHSKHLLLEADVVVESFDQINLSLF